MSAARIRSIDAAAALALAAGRLFGQRDMHAMHAEPGLVAAKQGSGTSWIPEASAHPALS